MLDPLKRSFSPVVDRYTRLLVLGSLPGDQSLRAARYYANPRNQFWALMSDVIGRDLVSLDYENRLAALLAANVGLWDVIGSAIRVGSLDAAIRAHRANPLAGLLVDYPSISAVAFNGAKSAHVGRRALGDTPRNLIGLPSSSPAFTMPLAEKRSHWMKLRAFL